MKQALVLTLTILIFAAPPVLSGPEILNDVIAAGGGESTGDGIRLTDTLGQPCAGTTVLSGTGYRLSDGFWTPRSDETPVFLLAFNHEAAPGRVDLSWACQPDGEAVDFRLTATLNGLSWEPDWSTTTPGLFTCRDEADPLIDGGLCNYKLEAKLDGESWLVERMIEIQVPALVLVTRLSSPYPNPFNPMVTLPVELARDGRVRIAIFDVTGRQQSILVDKGMTRGRHTLTWHGQDDSGQDLASGIYFLRMQAEDYSVTRRLVLLR